MIIYSLLLLLVVYHYYIIVIIVITIIVIIVIISSTVTGLLLQLVGHVLCTSSLQMAWKTFWKAFFDSFFWTSVGPSCVALPRLRENGDEDCREDAADFGRNWVQNAPRRVQNRWKMALGGLRVARLAKKTRRHSRGPSGPPLEASGPLWGAS